MWKERYKIGVDLIDEQHEELFKRVTDFIHTVKNSDSWESKVEKVKSTMIYMQDYVIKHFNDEEELQRRIGCPDIENHIKIHNDFKDGVTRYVETFEKDGYTEEIIQEFAGKLLTWLIMHVGKMDQQIGDYYAKKGGVK